MRSVGISLVTALLANTCVAQEAIVAELYERGSFQPSSARLGTHFTNGASFNHFGNCLSSNLAGINAAPSSGVLADICFI
jgi:hypothetical protein